MRCDNLFCIYWSKDECILDTITLDMKGVCESCIYIEMEENQLQQRRSQALSKEVDVGKLL